MSKSNPSESNTSSEGDRLAGDVERRVLSELYDDDAREYLNLVHRLVEDTGDNDDSALKKLGDFVGLPDTVTPDRIRLYIQTKCHPASMPKDAVSSAVATMGEKTYALCTAFSNKLDYPS